MNLLLLLSALLSALSGVGQAVRGTRMPQAVCTSIATAPTQTVLRAPIPSRPAQPLPGLVNVVNRQLVALRLPPVEPIFAGRRRE